MRDIFEKTNETENFDLRPDGISFKDCPNHCLEGVYIDPYIHQKKRCSYCEEKRKRMIMLDASVDLDETIHQKLHLPPSMTGALGFDPDSVIIPEEAKYFDPSSVEPVKAKMKELVDKISVGELPTESIMFNLGRKARESNFIYSFLSRAYIAGLTVAPMVTAYDVALFRHEAEEGTSKCFNELLTSQVLLIVLDAGCTSSGAVKGLMQLRGYRGLSTVIVTNVWDSFVRDLTNPEEAESFTLATMYSIKYKSGDNGYEKKDTSASKRLRNTSNGMSSEEFNALIKG